AASLECYSHYLNFEKETGSDPEAVSLAIDMAYRLEKFSLVRDYLFSLTPKARENLATPTLILAIHSFIYLGQATEAEKIASFLRHRANAPQLPSFDAMVNEKFGSTTKAKEFIQQHLNALPPKEFSADIQRSISIALAYMVENKHSEAEKVLLACKARHAA
ncbi:MAG TPA: hypothetical protein PLY93_15490, partial [Turneriella sp.]|nr:hypothetical protein [Turneriella sp.]